MTEGYKIKYGVKREEVTCIPNEIWDIYMPHIGGIGVLVYSYVYRLVNQRSKIDFEYMATELQLHYDDVQAAIVKLLEIELFSFSGANNNTIKVNDPKSKEQFERYLLSQKRDDSESRLAEKRKRKELEEQYLSDSIYSFAEKEFGRPLTSSEYRTIASLDDDYAQELIKEALSRAVLNNAANMPYVQRILFNWDEKGVRTLEQVRVEDENFKARRKKNTKKSSTSSRKDKDNKPNNNEVPYYYSFYDEREKKKKLDSKKP